MDTDMARVPSVGRKHKVVSPGFTGGGGVARIGSAELTLGMRQ